MANKDLIFTKSNSTKVKLLIQGRSFWLLRLQKPRAKKV
ncbi:hypothetical protein PESP_b0367 [Pseudoalteromonas espejiana DSM 9414]|nr:hypothetical protein PESP_b0367 [Pseudoalteromonas espejiana DSM 9414]